MNKYLLVIPAFNEELSIESVLKKVKKNTENIGLDIIVINDASTDKTFEIVKSQQVDIISHATNLGYGGAVQTGFKYAVRKNYDFVILYDADGQHDARYIKKLIKNIEKNSCDIVIGSRYLRKNPSKSIDIKRIGIGFFSCITSLMIDKKITDSTSGFQILNRKAFSYLSKGRNYPQYHPDADVIISLGKSGFIIGEYPVIMHKRKHGTSMHHGIVKHLNYTVKMLVKILGIQFRKNTLQNQVSFKLKEKEEE